MKNLHVIIGEDDFLVSQAVRKILGDAQGLEVIQTGNDAPDVTGAVTVGILETLGVDLVENRGFPPAMLALIQNDVAHNVYVDDEKIYLTPKEYDLLKYFILNKNVALTREQLLSNIWGYDFCGDDRTIDTHVKTLRNNLKSYRNLIITVRGIGYKFEYEEK